MADFVLMILSRPAQGQSRQALGVKMVRSRGRVVVFGIVRVLEFSADLTGICPVVFAMRGFVRELEKLILQYKKLVLVTRSLDIGHGGRTLKLKLVPVGP